MAIPEFYADAICDAKFKIKYNEKQQKIFVVVDEYNKIVVQKARQVGFTTGMIHLFASAAKANPKFKGRFVCQNSYDAKCICEKIHQLIDRPCIISENVISMGNVYEPGDNHCPNCEFNSFWDGIQCSHCKFVNKWDLTIVDENKEFLRTVEEINNSFKIIVGQTPDFITNVDFYKLHNNINWHKINLTNYDDYQFKIAKEQLSYNFGLGLSASSDMVISDNKKKIEKILKNKPKQTIRYSEPKQTIRYSVAEYLDASKKNTDVDMSSIGVVEIQKPKEFYFEAIKNANFGINYFQHQKDLIEAIDKHDAILVKKPRDIGFTTIVVHLILAALKENSDFKSKLIFDNSVEANEVFNDLKKLINENITKLDNYILIGTPVDIFDLIVIEKNSFEDLEINKNCKKIIIGFTPCAEKGEKFAYELWSDENYYKLDWARTESPTGIGNGEDTYCSTSLVNEWYGNFYNYRADLISSIDLKKKDNCFLLKINSEKIILTENQLNQLFSKWQATVNGEPINTVNHLELNKRYLKSQYTFKQNRKIDLPSFVDCIEDYIIKPTVI